MSHFPDEYQDATSAGSLVDARRFWLDLLDADQPLLAHRFTFVFRSPSQRMAFGLLEFLRYANYAGYVRLTHRPGVAGEGPWEVVGTTHATVCVLRRLESLFMSLRRAGSRYESTLVSLNRVPMSHCP